MFKKILLPTDGSEMSARAIDGGVQLAKELQASVVGMTVTEPYSLSSVSRIHPEAIADYQARMKQFAEERLAVIEVAAQAAGVAFESVVVASFSPYEAIIKTAHETGCDAIFMASHGRRGLGAVLLGSETQKVLTHSTLPVLVFR